MVWFAPPQASSNLGSYLDQEPRRHDGGLELSAAIIRPEHWPLRRWFYASPLWYYHAPGVNRHVRHDDRFYSLVDPHLRAICRMLHRAGLRTTASCQGHFHSRDHFAEVWDQLQREREGIVNGGLIVHDAETDAPQLLRDQRFKLPWEHFAAFYDEAAKRQIEGFLGVVVPRSDLPLARQLNLERYRTAAACIAPNRKLSLALGGMAFTITVRADSEAHQAAEWAGVYAYLQSVFEEAAGRRDEFTHFDRSLLVKR